MKTAMCFLSSKEFWSRTRLAIDSARHWNPALSTVVVSDSDLSSRELGESAIVLHPRVLNIGPEENWLLVGRPAIIEFAISKLGFGAAMLIDGDTYTYNPFEAALKELAKFSMLVVPHTMRPWPNDDRSPRMSQLNLMGNYNTGFFAANYRALQFMHWWTAQTREFPQIDLKSGFSGEQGWMRYAMDFDANATVFRNPGYNLAYWNVPDRCIKLVGDSYTVDDYPLVLAHFSGLLADTDTSKMSVHQDRHYLDRSGAAFKLYSNYQRLAFGRSN